MQRAGSRWLGEGIWRSLRSEDHCALALRSLEPYLEGRTPSPEKQGTDNPAI